MSDAGGRDLPDPSHPHLRPEENMKKARSKCFGPYLLPGAKLLPDRMDEVTAARSEARAKALSTN